MIASILIIAISLLLFLYWFRYTCVLILNTRTTKDFSAGVAEANQLSFREVPALLESSSSEGLSAIHASLDREYELINALLRQAGGLRVGGDSLEEIMLRIDFRIMRAWYGLTCRVSASSSRAALQEMSNIVAHFANVCGERGADSARA